VLKKTKTAFPMKKFLINLIMLTAMTITAVAQIPNNGFENWAPYGTGMTPNGWWCSNDSLSLGSTYFPVTRSSDHYPPSVGSYSIRIESNKLLTGYAGFGSAWAGNFYGQDHPAFPVTGHPKTLYGYFKYFPTDGDSFEIFWSLFKNGVSVGGGETIFVSWDIVMQWTPFSITIPDTTYAEADSARIVINDFNPYPFGNSVLFVDNLSFDSPVTGIADQKEGKGNFNLFPNPASGIVNLEFNPALTSTSVLNIYTVTGGLVRTFTLTPNQHQIDLTELNEGIYFVEIRSGERILRQKLIIRR
jgi:hypothetical protein